MLLTLFNEFMGEMRAIIIYKKKTLLTGLINKRNIS